MSLYHSYKESMDLVQRLIVDEIMTKIGFRAFENERGYDVYQVMPGEHEEYKFSTNKLNGVLDTKSKEIFNPMYKEMSLSLNSLISNPYILEGITESIYSAWGDVFGENYHMARQPDHPGNPPIRKSDFNDTMVALWDEFDSVCFDPSLEDLTSAIEDKNYRVAAHFLAVDNPQELLTPAGGHELANLFTNGNVHIVYQDADIAVLKPEYNHQIRVDIMNDRLKQVTDYGRVIQRRRFSLNGEQPEEAFVVGYDDTPVGLFAHVVDGTRLSINQTVSREYIHEVMGFDWNYNQDIDYLDLNVGESVRLQGDFAVQLVDEYNGEAENNGYCYLPIDNHLASLENGKIPESESLEQEPVRVIITEKTTLNVAHDEHENIIVDILPGEYEFYLLPRGIKIQSERPNWPPVQDE